ncbi:hypothetical protein [Tessaracoccus sp. OH4464_COT-324]|uniref:hypothetical protein n=1 Tax=Tessaracoccus sp. OH4464_COT-324 TaxID=2491059 RepID=UPI000F6399FD|nr:hypothetical protein [Tessaracoccus sp. OH4464_COT-324]RRD46319.1 hypothetical protein EII42_07360 [Tessaracoccus sp. OH4464_COT-324]
MMRLLGPVTAGCLLLSACTSADPVTTQQTSHISLPKLTRPWNDKFAASLELDRIEVSGQTVLIPEGLTLPGDAPLTATTEVALFLAARNPEQIRSALESSAEQAGYRVYSRTPEATVWEGRGMAVRLEVSPGMQVLAWGPAELRPEFIAQE